MRIRDSYDELCDKVDAIGGEILSRRREDFECRKGCTACCMVQLSVDGVEAGRVREAIRAMEPRLRRALQARARAMSRGSIDDHAPCVMLEADGGCAIYASRPLVCRTQGHALLYPKDSLPAQAVFADADGGSITWCPLNYQKRAPLSEDVLDAQAIDTALAQTNLEHCGGDPNQSTSRESLVDIVLDSEAR